MTTQETMEGVSKKVLPIIVIIDNSGSMQGEKIGQVNDGMRNVIEYLHEFNNDSDNTQTIAKVACLLYSDDAQWVDKDNPYVDAREFNWHDIEANGGANFGAALAKLNEVLTAEERGGWMQNAGGLAAILLLMSDGQSNPFTKELKDLKKRGWFASAIKLAIAIGKDADKTQLVEFTGGDERETVYECNAFGDLSKLIRLLVRNDVGIAEEFNSSQDDSVNMFPKN